MDLAKAPPCPKIVRRQKQLTPEQEAYARQFTRERVAAMREPEADEQAAEDHLRRAYQVAGLVPPRVRWFDSPVAFNQARELASKTEQAQDQEAKELWDDMQACVSNLQASMGFLPHRVYQRRLRWREGVQVAGEVVMLIGGIFLITDWLPQAWNLPWRVWPWVVLALYLWIWIWARVVKRLHRGRDSWNSRGSDSLWMCLHRHVSTALSGHIMWPGDLLQAIYGSEDSEEIIWNHGTAWDCVRAYAQQGRLTLCWFLHEVFEPNRLIHLARFNELVSGYYLGHELAWLVRKPIRMQQDADGLLHSGESKCLEYRDGWGIYGWHGVAVPERVILQPETLTREDWLNEPNLEVRRVMQERMPHFVETIGAHWLDTGKHGSLYAINLEPDPEGVAHYVHVRDHSSERSYYLRVPPTIQRADEAVAWTFGLNEQEYQPAQEA
jgi:hypothetical protein